MRFASPLPLILAAATLAAAACPAFSRDDDADFAEIDCRDPHSTYEMNACANREFVAADAELNRLYRRALAAVPRLATDEPPYNARSWTRALRASQRAWVAFRDADCKVHVAMFWGGGTGATADVIGCMEVKTKARIRELKERYHGS